MNIMKAIQELEMHPITALKAIANMVINENTDQLALCIAIAKLELEKGHGKHYCPLCGYEINE